MKVKSLGQLTITLRGKVSCNAFQTNSEDNGDEIETLTVSCLVGDKKLVDVYRQFKITPQKKD